MPLNQARHVDENPLYALDKRLVIKFSGNCWLEVKDKQGNILYTGIGNENKPVQLIISSPFDIRFGNTPALASVSYAGKAIAFSARKRITQLHISDKVPK